VRGHGGRIGRWSVTAFACLLACAAHAGAAVREGAGTDPSGDGAGPSRDLTALSATYDPAAGAISAQVTLAGAPDAGADAFVAVLLGVRQPSGSCAPAAGVGGNASGGAVAWVRNDTGAQGEGTRAPVGAALTLGAADPALEGQGYDCALVTLSAPGGGTTYDSSDPIALAEPAPTPTPGGGTTGAPPAAKRAAELALSVVRAPARARTGRWLRVRVRIANTGGAPAKRVRIKLARARGVAVRAPRPIATLAAGAGRTVTLRVRLRRRARARLVLRATARGALTARAPLTLRRRTKRPRHPAPATGLAGRYFWRTVTRVDYAWDNRGIAFVDGTWAYRGIPKGGLPACTKVTAGVDENGDPTDGCLRYSYDARTGRVTVGDQHGTYSDGNLTLGEDGYAPLQIPAPGARYDMQLVHRGFSGFCGLDVGCTTWTYYLTLRRDGQFALSSMTVSSMGGGGAPFTAAWNAPPDQRGTYEAQGRGRIRLAFADGTVSVRTIGIEQPAAKGLLLDDTNFYPDDD
jgi:hypothetical protein